MSASLEWSLTMTGRSRNKYLKEILEVLYEIEDLDADSGTSVFEVHDGKNFFTQKVQTSIFATNPDAVNIFGENYLEPEIDSYIRIAKAAPKAIWKVYSSCISESGGDGCETYLEVLYEDGKIEFKTENYIDTVMLGTLVARMDCEDKTFESFCAYYVVDESIDEDWYEENNNDDGGDDVFYNYKTNSVSREHKWETTIVSIDV